MHEHLRLQHTTFGICTPMRFRVVLGSNFTNNNISNDDNNGNNDDKNNNNKNKKLFVPCSYEVYDLDQVTLVDLRKSLATWLCIGLLVVNDVMCLFGLGFFFVALFVVMIFVGSQNEVSTSSLCWQLYGQFQ